MSLLPPRLSIRSNPKTVVEEYEELLNFTPRSDYPEDHPAEMRRNAQKIADMEKEHSVYELEGDVEIDKSRPSEKKTKDFPPVHLFNDIVSEKKFPQRITLIKAVSGNTQIPTDTKGYLILMDAYPGGRYSPTIKGFLYFKIRPGNASSPALEELNVIFHNEGMRDVYGDAIKSTYSDLVDFKLSPGAAAHLKAANPLIR